MDGTGISDQSDLHIESVHPVQDAAKEDSENETNEHEVQPPRAESTSSHHQPQSEKMAGAASHIMRPLKLSFLDKHENAGKRSFDSNDDTGETTPKRQEPNRLQLLLERQQAYDQEEQELQQEMIDLSNKLFEVTHARRQAEEASLLLGREIEALKAQGQEESDEVEMIGV